MAHPADILPRAVSHGDLARAERLIEAVEAALHAGRPSAPELEALKRLTGRDDLQMEDYYEISAAMSYRDAARLAFAPRPRRIDGLDRDGFEQICEEMLEADTALMDYWFPLFCLNARHPAPGDLVFDPPAAWIDRLKAEGAIPDRLDRYSFRPTPAQLAREAWGPDAAARPHQAWQTETSAI